MALGPVGFSGLTSGFDIKSIISAILSAERRPVNVLQSRQSGIDSRHAAYQSLGSKLASLRSVLQDLAAPSALKGRSVTSSDSALVTASAGTSAEIGAHDVEVQALARANRVRSIAVASRLDGDVADGTITVRSGNRDLITVNVSAASGNNSLVAVRDAINGAGAGVAASIVNDGTGDLLVVKATNTGSANALTIDDTTNLALASPEHVLESAADATVLVDGVSVTSASNTLTTAISGVTLNLVGAKVGTKVAVTVAADTAKVKDQVKRFVDAYNAVAEFTRSQFSADAGTGKAGVLAGDALLRRVQEVLSASVSGGIEGLPGTDLTTLGAIGVSIEGSSGLLKIDDAQLTSALTERFDQIGRLFGPSGRATDAAVAYAGVTAATNKGTYGVLVTAAPERAILVGGTKIAALERDETLTITQGSTSANVSLAAGDTLDTVITKVNSSLALAGVSVRATSQDGKLRLSSLDYGSGISISAVSNIADSGNNGTSGIGDVVLSDSGADIEGKINGAAAAGSGTVLTALGGAAEGLSVSVTASAETVASQHGDFGLVTVARGFADLLAKDIKPVVDSGGGAIATTIAHLDEETRAIRDRIAGLEARLKEREVFLTLQFDAAERAIQALQAQQAALGRSS